MEFITDEFEHPREDEPDEYIRHCAPNLSLRPCIVKDTLIWFITHGFKISLLRRVGKGELLYELMICDSHDSENIIYSEINYFNRRYNTLSWLYERTVPKIQHFVKLEAVPLPKNLIIHQNGTVECKKDDSPLHCLKEVMNLDELDLFREVMDYALMRTDHAVITYKVEQLFKQMANNMNGLC
jgi:hypothetical protein